MSIQSIYFCIRIRNREVGNPKFKHKFNMRRTMYKSYGKDAGVNSAMNLATAIFSFWIATRRGGGGEDISGNLNMSNSCRNQGYSHAGGTEEDH